MSDWLKDSLEATCGLLDELPSWYRQAMERDEEWREDREQERQEYRRIHGHYPNQGPAHPGSGEYE